MNRNTVRKLFRFSLGLLISVVFLWLVFRQIDLGQVWEAIREINAIWLIPAIATYFLGVWVRTTRWCLLMRPVKKSTTLRFFPIYIISYMANNVLPMRIGDLYRAYIVGKKEKVSKSASLVTIGVERIFDGLTMLMLLLVSIMFFPVEDPRVRQTVQIGSILFLGAIIICYILVLKRSWADWVFNKVLAVIPEKLHGRLKELFENFFQGLDSLRGFKDIVSVMCLSLATWLIEAGSYYLVLMAFGFYGHYHVAITAMALVNLMIIFPAAPGYFGPFELACVIILGKNGYGSVTGFGDHVAVAYALILHVVVQWIPSTLMGLVFMWTEHISFSEIEKDTSDSELEDHREK